MSGQTEHKAPMTSSELEKLVDAGVRENEISMDAPEDIVFENGPRAGQKLSAKDLAKEMQSDPDPQPNREEEIILPGKDADPKAAKEPKAEDSEATEEDPAAETPEPEPKGEPAADVKADESKVDEYQPNTVYKVYDQEKQFPDWAKPLATSKEVEENLRSTLQKSEAFEVLKPKHENVVRERDEAKGHVDDHVRRVQRMSDLRDKDLPLFLRSMGVPPKALVDYAANLAYLEKEDPDGYRRELASVDDRARKLDESDAIQRQAQDVHAQRAAIHEEAKALTFARPDVVSTRARIDATYGQGFFEKAFENYGSAKWLESRTYVQPADVARWVMETYGSNLPPVSAAAQPVVPPVNQSAPAQQVPNGSAPAPQPKPTPPRVKTLPNVGRGTAASPVKARPKSFKDLEKLIEAEG